MILIIIIIINNNNNYYYYYYMIIIFPIECSLSLTECGSLGSQCLSWSLTGMGVYIPDTLLDLPNWMWSLTGLEFVFLISLLIFPIECEISRGWGFIFLISFLIFPMEWNFNRGESFYFFKFLNTPLVLPNECEVLPLLISSGQCQDERVLTYISIHVHTYSASVRERWGPGEKV